MDWYGYNSHWVLSRPLAQRWRVLDFGCGSGKVVAKWRVAGVAAQGCDLYLEDRAGQFSTPNWVCLPYRR